MCLIMNVSQLTKNCQVRLVLNNDEVYQGVYLGGTENSVELIEVVDQNGQKLAGSYTFYHQEIAKMQVKAPKVNGVIESDLSSEQSCSKHVSPKKGEQEKLGKEEIERLQEMALNANLIKEVHNEPIKLLCETSSVGLVCLGMNNVDPTIKLIVLSNRNYAFVFDVVDYTEENFPHGLKNLLEGEEILKIIHGDVSLTEKCLKDNYGVVLCNYYDTQHWDSFIYKRDNQLEETVLRKLSETVEDILGASASIFFKAEETNKNIKKWGQRPLPDTRRFSAALLAVFLVHLRMGLENKALKKVHQSTKAIYDYFCNMDNFKYSQMIYNDKCHKEMWDLVLI